MSGSWPPTGRTGSSPRVRGTGRRARDGAHIVRFIPAGAGNSMSMPACATCWPVHPRGCGEQTRPMRSASIAAGSSPRVRGTERPRRRADQRGRFIPAGAGNRARAVSDPPTDPVHPRGCGEQHLVWDDAHGDDGSSPRVRGTVRNAGGSGHEKRFIPAGAGNSGCVFRCRRIQTVHPRGCGEQASWHAEWSRATGSSPRVRGTGHRTGAHRHVFRFIPAGAGNRSRWAASTTPPTVHPRGCGEQGRITDGC